MSSRPTQRCSGAPNSGAARPCRPPAERHRWAPQDTLWGDYLYDLGRHNGVA
jgi:hypothetical protein